MDIDFRKIVEILEIDAPVHFTPKDELNKKDDVFCRFVSNTEQDAIINGSYSADKKYDTSDIGLHYPDIKIDEYYELEYNRNSVAINSRIAEIGNKMIVYMPEIPLLFAVYCILHEYGHWIYFLNSKMSSYEYCEAEKRIRQSYKKLEDEIYRMPDYSPCKRMTAKQYDEKIFYCSAALSSSPDASPLSSSALHNSKIFCHITHDWLVDRSNMLRNIFQSQ